MKKKSKTSKAKRLIVNKAGATIFSCLFIKRTDGQPRRMVCRLGVAKDLKGRDNAAQGKGLAYNPEEHNLLTVWDVQKQAYRSIPLDAVLELKIRGVVYPIQEKLKIASQKGEVT